MFYARITELDNVSWVEFPSKTDSRIHSDDEREVTAHQSTGLFQILLSLTALAKFILSLPRPMMKDCRCDLQSVDALQLSFLYKMSTAACQTRPSRAFLKTTLQTLQHFWTSLWPAKTFEGVTFFKKKVAIVAQLFQGPVCIWTLSGLPNGIHKRWLRESRVFDVIYANEALIVGVQTKFNSLDGDYLATLWTMTNERTRDHCPQTYLWR